MDAHSRPLRTTLIRHEPDPHGPPPHFDWMLEPSTEISLGSTITPESRDVLTWRAKKRPDRLEIGEMLDLEQIENHRRIWLDRDPGLTIDLRPPLGRATILRQGTTHGPVTTSGELLEFNIDWSESDDIHHLRLENRGPHGARLLRLPLRAEAPSPDGAPSC